VRVPGQNDVDLVRRAQQGEREAFTELFNRLHQPVLSYVYHMLGDRQSAEDVTQDAFIRAHQKIDHLGPPWDFKSWVFRIASNLAIDYIRGGRRFVEAEDEELMAEPPTTRRPLERRVQQEELRQGIRKTLDAMPTSYRQALILRELNGLSYDEVARALECSYENARQLVHRARLRFRELHGLRLALAGGPPRCQELGDLLSAYHDGELKEMDRRAVRAHMASCAECRETRDDLKKMGALLAGLAPVLPSPEWTARVLERLGLQELPAPSVAGDRGAGRGGGGGPGGMGGGGGLPTPLPAGLGGAGLSPWLLLGLGLPLLGLVIALAAQLLPLAVAAASPTPAGSSPAETAPAATAEPSTTPTPLATLHSPLLPAASPIPTEAPTTTLGMGFAFAPDDVPCRVVLGDRGEIGGTFLAGSSAPIEGRSADWSWWWIPNPDGLGHCWVWDGAVQVSGDTAGVPLIVVPTDTPIPSLTPTPTLGPPMVTALLNANCRFGPGMVYDVIAYMLEGQTAPIEGRNAESTWWYIRRVDGVGHCWIWEGLVTLSGDLSGVPIVPSPPTPTPVDDEPPLVQIAHAPTGVGQPDTSDVVTFTATATDNVGVARIEIWLTGPGSRQARLVRSCSNVPSCIYPGGPFPSGTGSYFARAWDLAGNVGESPTTRFTVYYILQ